MSEGPMSPAERADMFAIKFRSHANHIAFQFGGPLYLVGSYLTSPMPGDIDLRLILERADAVLLFGEDPDHNTSDWPPGKMLMHREELKQSRRMTRRWRGAFGPQRFDFQFQIGLFSDIDGLPIFNNRPRIRLDTVPLSYFDAGRNDP